MIEYVLIAMGVGLNITFAQAYVIGGLTSLVQNVIFFVPFEVGTKEGSLYLVFDLLGLDPALGVYTAIVSRLRDLAWIGGDRKSTRLNSSHTVISYAVFCLKKKTHTRAPRSDCRTR